MDQHSYRRHRFPPLIIQHAIWLYLRFTLRIPERFRTNAKVIIRGYYDPLHVLVGLP